MLKIFLSQHLGVYSSAAELLPPVQDDHGVSFIERSKRRNWNVRGAQQNSWKTE